MGGQSEEITTLLARVRDGSESAESRLAKVVHQELHRIAARYMRRERPGHSLQPTALVNDAYMKLLAQDKDWQNRAHFFAVASSVMRRILIDHARGRTVAKRGGGMVKVELTDGHVEKGLFTAQRTEELLALDQALSRLKELDARQHQIVEMRFFGGMTDQEIAAVLRLSDRTIGREWTLARAWLHSELSR